MKKMFFVLIILMFAVSCVDSKKSFINDNSVADDSDAAVTDDSNDKETQDAENDEAVVDEAPDQGSDNDPDLEADNDPDLEADNDPDLETDDDPVSDLDIIEPDGDSELPDIDTVGMCQENSECGKEEFCKKETDDCDGYGVCDKKPLSCAEIYAPVCGCDEKTYGNECSAHGDGVNVAYEGECTSTVTYSYIDSGMPLVSLDGKLVINEGGTKHLFDTPDPAKRTKSSIEVTFKTKGMGPSANTVVFSFSRSELPNQVCTPTSPCKIPFGKGDSKALWKVSTGSGDYLNGELTGTIYITENVEDTMQNIFKFNSSELIFHPMG